MGEGELIRKGGEILAIATISIAELRESIEANLGPKGKVPISSLNRIKLPTGGGQSWEVPDVDAEGGEYTTKELLCVIVHHGTQRAYWARGIEEGGGGATPDCSSRDGDVGVGNPGGACDSCRFNEFGSAKGRGKACKEMRVLWILLPQELMPMVLTLPATSIQPFQKFMLELVSKGAPFWSRVTRIMIKEKSNKDGIRFGAANFSTARGLTEVETAAVKAYAEMMRPRFTASDIVESEASVEA
jgi:hypothetical protein